MLRIDFRTEMNMNHVSVANVEIRTGLCCHTQNQV